MTNPQPSRTHLSVNINKVALLRNTRHLGIPSLTRAARQCIEAGADGITVHPRPDERHIRAADVQDIASMLKDYPQIEFNIEGNPLHNLMDFIRQVRPTQCTFVPDSAGQFTSDHGWQLPKDLVVLQPLIQEAQDLGVRVSLFMDADLEQLESIAKTGADRVELYTEPWAESFNTEKQAQTLLRYREAADCVQAQGLAVNAGHDLNLYNLTPFLRGVTGIAEVSIGHALIADALEMGYCDAVKAYLACISDALA